LAESNLTHWSGTKALDTGVEHANYINYGVREFGMTAIMNGLALHGGFIPYGGTFLVFSDYARNAVRLAALMGLRTIYVYTHDSIGLGEDGPTHQPIEHAASLRLIPHLDVWRPCDAVETVIAWRQALQRRDGPSALLLSRQALAPQSRTDEQLRNVARGGYILSDSDGDPELLVLATGSEVALAMAAAQSLRDDGKRVRVVSMPSTGSFDRQEQAYRDSVLPPAVRRRVAIEAGSDDFWRKYVGLDGQVVGLSTFGESAPGPIVMERMGLTLAAILAAANSQFS
jgi:transketolase